MEQRLVPIRGEIAGMAGGLFGVVGVPFEQTTELQRQVLATFAFGMIFAVGRVHRLLPAEVHALSICCLQDVFRYSDEQATAFCAVLIAAASSNDPKDMKRPIIHRGINGHRQWQMGQTELLKANLEGIFKVLGV
jgi:hypothetical protein